MFTFAIQNGLIFHQPPKKKGEKGKGKRGSKKTGSGRAQTLIDGVPINTMTKEQLEGHVVRCAYPDNNNEVLIMCFVMSLRGNTDFYHETLRSCKTGEAGYRIT